jgi:hypothetical protein
MSLSRRLAMIAGLAVSALPIFAPPASAQTPPVRLRGTIAGLEGSILSVVTREGPTVAITLPDGLQPGALKRLSLDGIGPDSFIATVAAPDAEGMLTAIYVQVLPDNLRATAQLHSDWDLAPGTSMTNAIVSSVVSARTGRKLSMTYRGTPIDVVVPETVPVIMGIPASRADLVPGAKVFVVTQKTETGYLAQRIVVGKDGVNPPQ